MTGEALFYSFALIDETYIKEAEKPSNFTHKTGSKVLAACLLLVLLLGSTFAVTDFFKKDGTSDSIPLLPVSESKQLWSKAEKENSGTETLPNLDQLLEPYQEVIDRLNKENGWCISIPENSKQQVYDYYKNYSMEEFEQELRKEMAERGY